MLIFSDVNAASYTWIHNNDRYDFVVSVEVYGKPSGVGVLFDRNLVLTSATVGEIYNKVNPMYDVRVVAIYGEWDRSTSYRCTCGITPYQIERQEFWLSVGVDGHHCPVHDLFVLHCPARWGYFGPEAVNATYRMAYSTYLARPHHGLFSSKFKMIAFGYVDQDHVEKMDQLELDHYHDPDMRVECDDYIPREWGRFICIISRWYVVGLQSGAPLTHQGLVYGIASFTLQKGDETILVFTDIRGYSQHLYFCKRYWGNKYNHYWWSRYWR